MAWVERRSLIHGTSHPYDKQHGQSANSTGAEALLASSICRTDCRQVPKVSRSNTVAHERSARFAWTVKTFSEKITFIIETYMIIM
jgi:hypothetical protein